MKIDIKENNQEKTIEVTVTMELNGAPSYPRGPDFPPQRNPNAVLIKATQIRDILASRDIEFGTCVEGPGYVSNTSTETLTGTWIFEKKTLTNTQKSGKIGETPKKASRSRKQKK